MGGSEHWGGPQVASELAREALERIHHKAPWLNVGFFVARGFIYVAIASFVSERLLRMSLRLDSGKDDNWSLLAQHAPPGVRRAAVRRARHDVRGLRLADEPEPDLVLDDLRRLLLRRQLRRGAVDARDRHLAGRTSRTCSAAA